jgi:predicted nucleic acid-binding protein
LGQHIAQQIVIIAQNQEEKERVKSYSDALGQLMNEIKAFGQRLQEKMQEQNGQSGIDPETLAKVQAMILQAQTKSQNSREQSQQKEAQKALKFEREMKEREVEFVQDMKQRGIETQVEVAAQDAKVAAEIQREAAKPNPKAKTE